MKKQLLVIPVLLLALSHINAKVKLPSILASHMVLQQNSVVKLWGWSDKSGVVKIKTSWSAKLYVANISETGKWTVDISTSSAGGPYNIILMMGIDLALMMFIWEKCGFVPDNQTWKCLLKDSMVNRLSTLLRLLLMQTKIFRLDF